MFDNADRLTGRRYPDGSRVTLAYNALSDRTLMQDGNGRTTFGYDNARRLLSVVNPASTRITYGYDGASQRTLLIEVGGGRFTSVWDAAGRIDHMIDTQGYRTSWTYDAANRTLTQRLGNGVRASYSYDNADRLLTLANITSTGTTLSSFYYALDAVGNRTAGGGGGRHARDLELRQHLPAQARDARRHQRLRRDLQLRPGRQPQDHADRRRDHDVYAATRPTN